MVYHIIIHLSPHNHCHPNSSPSPAIFPPPVTDFGDPPPTQATHLRPPGQPRDGFSPPPPPPSSQNLGSILAPHPAELLGGEGGGEEAGEAVELGGLDVRRPHVGVLVAEEDMAIVELDGANELRGRPEIRPGKPELQVVEVVGGVGGGRGRGAWGRGRRAAGCGGAEAGKRERGERKGKRKRGPGQVVGRGAGRAGGGVRPGEGGLGVGGRLASRGAGQGWLGAGGGGRREKEEKREKGERERKSSTADGRPGGRRWVAGVGGGSPGSVAGGGKIAGDGEEFGWE
ncbi:hypothetical protein TIFTF001_019015 [Ficus carica]|uniref:Uncharacterized protein n=1 Tax=Ficus carica TaxID=3494 RepID=A0AA88ADJ7_FICCA|nr:hypothetical protein TIFTF001_019015 [Ficus carica]